MPISWFDTREVDELADAVVAELMQRFPPAGIDLSTRKAAERALRAIDSLMLRVSEFARTRRPNVYKKARFGNRVKWALKEAGYPGQFVEVVTEGMVTQVALGARKGKSA